MKIGIISDTHDNMPMIQRAVELLNARKVGHVIHAGDFTSPFTFRALKHLICDFTGIYGNNDGERVLLQQLSHQRIFTHQVLMRSLRRYYPVKPVFLESSCRFA